MKLYHGTTEIRAKQIFCDRKISCRAERYYTKENCGGGYSSDGYIYLTNEITFSVFFANSHSIADKSMRLYLFKVDVPKSKIEPDYDEIRIQAPADSIRTKYKTDIDLSLMELKACRVPFDIAFDKFTVEYSVIDKGNYDNFPKLFDHAGRNYEYVTSHYTNIQEEFISSLQWEIIK